MKANFEASLQEWRRLEALTLDDSIAKKCEQLIKQNRLLSLISLDNLIILLESYPNQLNVLIILEKIIIENTDDENAIKEIMQRLLAKDLLEAIKKNLFSIDKVMQLLLTVTKKDANKWLLLRSLSHTTVIQAISDDIISLPKLLALRMRSSVEFFNEDIAFHTQLLALLVQLMTDQVIKLMRHGRLSMEKILALAQDDIEATVKLLQLILNSPASIDYQGWENQALDVFEKIATIAIECEQGAKNTYLLLSLLSFPEFIAAKEPDLQIQNILLAVQHDESNLSNFIHWLKNRDLEKIRAKVNDYLKHAEALRMDSPALRA